MPASNYLIKSQPESALLVSSSTTVENDVGICYFDPIDETLKEISTIDNHIITIQPYKKAIRKYYLVVGTNSSITTISITPSFTSSLIIDPTDYYSIKTIISATEPTLSQLDDQDDMNEAEIMNPDPGAIIPIWMLIESKVALNSILGLSFTVDYE